MPAKMDGDAVVTSRVPTLICHCEERSDVAISIRLNTRRRTAVATATRLPRYARNDKVGTHEGRNDLRSASASEALRKVCSRRRPMPMQSTRTGMTAQRLVLGNPADYGGYDSRR